jgi:tetratricopeptide (TPR) repeat protein
MAPEQLRQLTGRPATVDGRADVFGLGVVLFELLTGRHAFPDGETPDVLLRGRSGPPPPLRPLNPAVTPSAEAIVRRCLEPDAMQRYPSAQAVAEDLERQLADQPLAHTREPSMRERFRKWRRRHPRLTSSGTVAAVAAVLVLTATGAAFAGYERSKRLEREWGAADHFRRFQAEIVEPVDLLTLHGDEPAKRAKGTEWARSLVGQYGAVDENWEARPAVALLPEADRRELRTQIAELLLLLARTEALPADQLDPPGRRAALSTALDLTDRAAALYRGETAPRAVWNDRARLLEKLDRRDEAAGARKAADALAPGARDFYLDGLARSAEKKHSDAARLLESAVELDPKNYFAWLALGDAQTQLGRNGDAEVSFQAAAVLRPDLPFADFDRGLARLRRKEFAGAERAFTAALRVKSDDPAARVNRAIARLELGKSADAVADLDRALELGATETRLYFLRADARQRAGDKAGAAADRITGLVRPPVDEVSYVTRGLFRARIGHTAGALADFDAALSLNPRSYPALQNKAYVLSEVMNRDADSIVVLGQAIERYPDALLARAGRAVLLARRGDRAAAHADAAHCLARGPEPFVVYQLAGVYAMTSRTNPEDARTAFRLLADALRLGVGFEYVETDRDLDPLRSVPEFKLVVETARALRPKKD